MRVEERERKRERERLQKTIPPKVFRPPFPCPLSAVWPQKRPASVNVNIDFFLKKNSTTGDYFLFERERDRGRKHHAGFFLLLEITK